MVAKLKAHDGRKHQSQHLISDFFGRVQGPEAVSSCLPSSDVQLAGGKTDNNGVSGVVAQQGTSLSHDDPIRLPQPCNGRSPPEMAQAHVDFEQGCVSASPGCKAQLLSVSRNAGLQICLQNSSDQDRGQQQALTQYSVLEKSQDQEPDQCEGSDLFESDGEHQLSYEEQVSLPSSHTLWQYDML